MTNRLLRTLKILLRGSLWGIIALVTLECCARLDDWVSYGAPLLGVYDNTVLNAFDKLGEHGRPYARYLKWSLNSLGYRGPEIDPAAVHILCVGSSETFGQMESEGNEWPRQLERLLNQQAPAHAHYQLVNTAFPGETFPTSVTRLPARLAQIHPKLVLIYPSVAHYLWVPYVTGKEPPPPPPAFRLRMQARIENTLKQALPLAFQTWLRQRQIKAEGPTYGPALDTMPPDLRKRFREDLETAVSDIRQAGAEPVLITHANRFKDHIDPAERFMLVSWRRFYPMLTESGFLPMEAAMNAVIREVAAADSVTLIDAAQAMPSGPKYFGDFVHFNDLGAQVFSGIVARQVGPLLN